MNHKVRQFVRRLLPPAARSAIRRILPSYEWVNEDIHRKWREADSQNWPSEQPSASSWDLTPYEYRLFSQDGEDGIIRYLLSQIGSRSRRFLEFGFHPKECNCLRLAVKEGYGGLFIDGNKRIVRDFRRAARHFGLRNVNSVAKLLTLENLERTVKRGGLRGEIDVASIDVDGNDYWLWERLQCVSPLIVVIEYNPSLGPVLSLTVPYDPAFDRHEKHESGFFHGASITALQRLGRRKGYRLVGCNSTGVNAFFLREDLPAPGIKTFSPEEAYKPSKYRLDHGFSAEMQYELIRDLPYTQID